MSTFFRAKLLFERKRKGSQQQKRERMNGWALTKSIIINHGSWLPHNAYDGGLLAADADTADVTIGSHLYSCLLVF